MNSFAVVTDSTADLPQEYVSKLGINVVPLSVTFGTESFQDGELSQAEFFDRMGRAPELPSTSQPAIGAFVEAYEKALENAEQVLSVHISDKLSGTIESARQAAATFGDRVHVFDSRNLSLGLGLQVIEAARASAEGATLQAALARVENVRDRVKIIVGLDSLDNLARGGRIGAVSAFFGSLLDLKVTLTVDPTGAFQPVKRTRGEKAALKHTLDWVSQAMGTSTKGAFAVGHALSKERAEWLRDEILKRFEATDMVMYDAGIVISTHTGTGWGVIVVPAE